LPQCDVQRVRDLCPPRILSDLRRACDANQGSARENHRAWLDDRSLFPRYEKCFREYTNPLTASQLYTSLQQARFDHPTLPDADRRLM
jgi:hypothetical protein